MSPRCFGVSSASRRQKPCAQPHRCDVDPHCVSKTAILHAVSALPCEDGVRVTERLVAGALMSQVGVDDRLRRPRARPTPAARTLPVGAHPDVQFQAQRTVIRGVRSSRGP